MSNNKFVKGMVMGALAGAGLSLLDKSTRKDVSYKVHSLSSDMKYYSKHRRELKMMLQEKVDMLQSVYAQFSQDAQYITNKVNEFKNISPQVKSLVTDTKEALSHSKEEYKSIVKEEDFTLPLVSEHKDEEGKSS